MIITDSLIRRMIFGHKDFFNKVKIRDASRALYEIKDGLELPKFWVAPYFPEGREFNYSVRDATPGRLREEKFDLAFLGNLFYRSDSEEIITITIGSKWDGFFDRSELKKLEEIARPSKCGTYIVTLEIPVPENLAKTEELIVTSS